MALDIQQLRAPPPGKLAFYTEAKSGEVTLKSFGFGRSILATLKGAAADLFGLRDAWERDGSLPITNIDKLITALANAIATRENYGRRNDGDAIASQSTSIRDRIVLTLPAGRGRSDPAALVQATREALNAYELQCAAEKLATLTDQSESGILHKTAVEVIRKIELEPSQPPVDPQILPWAKTILSHQLPQQLNSPDPDLPGSELPHIRRDLIDAYISGGDGLLQDVKQTIFVLGLVKKDISAPRNRDGYEVVPQLIASAKAAGYPAATVDAVGAQVLKKYSVIMNERVKQLLTTKTADEIQDVLNDLIETEIPKVFDEELKTLAFGSNHEVVFATAKGLLGALTLHEHADSFTADHLKAVAAAFQEAANAGKPPATPQQKRAALAFALGQIARSNHTTAQELAGVVLKGLAGSSAAQFALTWADEGDSATQGTLQLLKEVIGEMIPQEPEKPQAAPAKPQKATVQSRIRKFFS